MSSVTDKPLTAEYVVAAAKALGWMQKTAAVTWIGEDQSERQGHLRGFTAREGDVRASTVRVTMKSGMETELSFDGLVTMIIQRTVAEGW